MKYILFLALLVPACGQGMEGSDPADPVDATPNTISQEEWEIWRGFGNELSAYTSENSLPGDWWWWVKTRASTPSGQTYHNNRFFFPFVRARTNREVRFLVQYLAPTSEIYQSPFTNEGQHLALLEEYLDLSYKGWIWKADQSAQPDQVDLVVQIGQPQNGGVSHYDGVKTVNLVYETAVVHESLHWLGMLHHYCGASPSDDQTDCHELPPGEGECVMNRQLVFGHVERFVLQTLPNTQEERDRLNEISAELLSHYH